MYSKFVINTDNCPKLDTIIEHNLCSGCKYYKGFELYNGSLPCVKCSYYETADE